MSEILKSIKARLNRLKKIEEEHQKNTDDIIRQKQKNTQEKRPSQSDQQGNTPPKERFHSGLSIILMSIINKSI